MALWFFFARILFLSCMWVITFFHSSLHKRKPEVAIIQHFPNDFFIQRKYNSSSKVSTRNKFLRYVLIFHQYALCHKSPLYKNIFLLGNRWDKLILSICVCFESATFPLSSLCLDLFSSLPQRISPDLVTQTRACKRFTMLFLFQSDFSPPLPLPGPQKANIETSCGFNSQQKLYGKW